jgi:hypothetical protein
MPQTRKHISIAGIFLTCTVLLNAAVLKHDLITHHHSYALLAITFTLLVISIIALQRERPSADG